MARGAKIALGGEGGQGVQSVAGILSEAAYEEGFEALYIPNFGVEQRGGVSVAYVQISDEPIGSPKFKTGDIVVALSDRAVYRTKKYVGPNTVFVYDAGIQGVEDGIPQNAAKVLAIPAVQVAKEELHPRVFNVVILGAIIAATKVVSMDKIKDALEKKLGYKFEQDPSLRELNFKALQRGAELVQQGLV
ncbi:ketoisovalerate oxidoreductase [Clostridiales bacterium PH28_bin88]|nr:ketoisovalerate oxidoreductase [Clostridiales bacterium PH28_bin88]